VLPATSGPVEPTVGPVGPVVFLHTALNRCAVGFEITVLNN